MDADSQPPEFVVDTTFKTKSPHDCTLRTSDGVEFKVLRSILGVASPVFGTMFELPQGGTHSQESIPVVDLSEDALVIQDLLRCIYPLPVSQTYTLPRIRQLLKTFDKYEISARTLACQLSHLYDDKPKLRANATAYYAIAWRLKLKVQARAASRYLHKVDLADTKVINEMMELCADVRALLSLMDLRQRRAEAVTSVLRVFGLRALLCADHSGAYVHVHESNEEYWYQEDALQRKVKAALQVPFPKCYDPYTFFNLEEGAPPAFIQDDENENPGCCLTKRPDAAAIAEAVDDFPQEISM